jgi:thiol-disulfide isomerase/thioredoxin
MNRIGFLQSIVATTATATLSSPQPSPSASTTVSATPAPWDLWDKSQALPYDRPIEVTMDLLDAGKERFRLSHYRGSAVVLNIFATWCGPCNHEQPNMVAIAERYASQGLSVIGIDCKDEDDAVRTYRKKYAIPYPIAMDRDGGFSYGLEVGKSQPNIVFPVSIFITPDGFLYGVLIGGLSAAELEYRVKKFLADVSPELTTPSPSPLKSP